MRYVLIFCFGLLCACTGKKHEGHVENSDLYYTCSMDPQVVESKPGKCPICKMPLLKHPIKQPGGSIMGLPLISAMLTGSAVKYLWLVL